MLRNQLSVQVPSGIIPPSSGGTGTSTVFTQGSVIFAGAGGVYSQDNPNFFWDATNHRLGIGTSAPANALHVSGTGNLVQIGDGTNAADYISFAGSSIATTARGAVGYDGVGMAMQSGASKPLNFYVNSGTFATGLAMTILSSGNVGINTPTPAVAFVVGGNQTGNAGLEVTPGAGVSVASFNRLASYTSLSLDGSSINIRPAGTTALNVSTAQVTATGNLIFGADNTYDIGGSAANRPRNLNVASNVGIGTAANSTFPLDIAVTSTGTTGFRITNSGTGTAAQIQNQLKNAAGSFAYYGLTDAAFNTAPIINNSAYFGSNGVNVSVFTQSANDIVFGTGGVASANERMRILSTGQVGIGTASPTSRLQIGDATVSVANQIVLGKYEAATETALPLVQQKSVLTAGGGNDLAMGAVSTSGGVAFYTGLASTPSQLGSGSNAIRMAILSGGNVGIGTTAPGALLDIGKAGTTLGTMRLEGSTSGYVQLQPAVAAGSITLTLPATTGTAGQSLNTDGAGALSFGTPMLLSTTTGIDGKAIANTALYIVPAGKTAIIVRYVVRVSAATAITTGPAAGIGNVAGTNNISASQAMNVLTSTTSIFIWDVLGQSISTAAAGVIYYNQGTGATGTSETLTIDLMGYLV